MALTGAATPLLEHALEPRLPSGPTASTIFGGLVALAAIFTVPILALELFAGDPDNGEDPPRLLGLALLVPVLLTLWAWKRYWQPDWIMPASLRLFGTLGLAATAVIAAAYLVREINAIL
jgi:hypothetical protein